MGVVLGGWYYQGCFTAGVLLILVSVSLCSVSIVFGTFEHIVLCRQPIAQQHARVVSKQILTLWSEQVSHGAIQFMVYEELKRVLSKGSAEAPSRTLTSLEITLVGAASKLFATLSTYPLAVSLHPSCALQTRRLSSLNVANAILRGQT